MKRKTILILVAMLAMALPLAAADAGAREARPKVQIAILLDTSNSMDGLIAQAKSELWKVVNEFVGATVDGVRPELYVALYEYGNDGLPAAEGHIRKVLDLTDDLDKVSEELFALKTNGGSEFCGWVIDHATRNLGWASGKNDLKVIFIAGNEPFTQGKVNYTKSCALAISKGIVVNTIFCGQESAGISGKWKEGALLADGSFMNIDQNRVVAHVTAPQDRELAKLSAELNTTYVAYGRHGSEGRANQKKQDENARSMGRSSLGARAASKASGYYRNDRWDLVDAVENEKVKMEELKDEELPEEMRKMNPAEREAHVKKQLDKRRVVQKKIAKLSGERKTYVAAEMKKRATEGGKSLDQAMIEAIRSQAARKNFEMK